MPRSNTKHTKAKKNKTAAPDAAFNPAQWMPSPEVLAESWSKAFENFKQIGTGEPGGAALSFDHEKLLEIQSTYIQQATELWNKGLVNDPHLDDKRFKDPAWQQNPVASFAAALYLLNSKTLMDMTQALHADTKTQARIKYAVEQFTAAASPTNYLALNAEAQQKIIETKGESLSKGIQNLVHDISQGHVSMTDESLFKVGENVATTQGSVVFENEFFQLIEYKPRTPSVYKTPLLLVPPCINKYYILDLQAKNSFVQYCADQGFRTFIVSWVNPHEELAHASWDDYVEQGVICAIQTTREISNVPKINTLGFCVGGTLLTSALAVLSARQEKMVASTTLLTTLVDFSQTGVLDVFIDESFVKFRELQFAQGGLMSGKDMATTFNFLRPNDLVWNYVVGNYLKGETPPPFDLLYWNSDSTNLPGPMYAWYLRNTYLENNLIRPGAISICGEEIDLSLIDLPMYIYGSKEDHIVPIDAAYASTQIFKKKKRFVMGASGHIAGVINPPSSGKRSYWTGVEGKFPPSLESWLESAKEHPGSWWSDWTQWLITHTGEMVAAPKGEGRGKYKAIEPAPGRYVGVKC
jgi:polyhydroxyalkanoate synthase